MTISKNNFLGAGLLAGTIIGAGIFSLPYIFRASGAFAGVTVLFIGAMTYVALYKMYAQIIIATNGDYRFVGYARLYLGRAASYVAILISIVQTVFVLTIYLILSRSFANLIISSGPGLQKLVVFWVIGSAIIFIGIRRIAWLETLITLGMFIVLAVIFIKAAISGTWEPGSLVLPGVGALLLPLGPVLFSLAGRQAIPKIVKLGGDYKKPIAWGVIISAVVYLIFAVSVLALSPVVTEDAVSGLASAIPGAMLFAVIGIFGVLSLLSSYGTVGSDVFESLELDLGLPFWVRFLIIVFGPIALYLGGLQDFIALVGFVGGVFVALEGIFIITMWRKATGNKLSMGHIGMFLMFSAALVYELAK